MHCIQQVDNEILSRSSPKTSYFLSCCGILLIQSPCFRSLKWTVRKRQTYMLENFLANSPRFHFQLQKFLKQMSFPTAQQPSFKILSRILSKYCSNKNFKNKLNCFILHKKYKKSSHLTKPNVWRQKMEVQIPLSQTSPSLQTVLVKCFSDWAAT